MVEEEITDISADTEEPTKVVEDVIDQYVIFEGVGQVAIEVLDAKEAEMFDMVAKMTLFLSFF